MSERLVLSLAASQALAGLSRALLSATRTASLYPGDHPVVRASVTRLEQAVGTGAEARVTAVISVTPSSLLVEGAEPADDLGAADRDVIAQTAELLHARGILEIGFDAPTPSDAVARLLAFLARLGSDSAFEGTIADAWARDGHPAVRLQAIDYAILLEQRQARTASPKDDIWRAIVDALRSGRRTLDEQEQRRLLELARDPAELAGLAETLMADKCTPEGAPLVATQAATVLACFRHLASIASVIAPDRAREILSNLASALLRLDPHVTMQVLALEGSSTQAADAAGVGTTLAASLGEDAVAQLLAAIVGLEGEASPRLSQMFELLVPDRAGQRRVLDRARGLVEARRAPGDRPFDAFWHSVEELLLSYDDEPFVSQEYRAVLDGARSAAHTPAQARMPEMAGWLETLTEPALRDVSVAMLADLLRLEPASDRAVVVLNHMGDLCDELLAAGAFADAHRVLAAIARAGERNDVATAAAQVLERVSNGPGVRETLATVGELDDEDWEALQRCYVTVGPSVLVALLDAIGGDEDTRLAARIGEVFVAMAEAAVAPLAALLERAGGGGRRRIACLLGRIGSPSAVPALQLLLRTGDGRSVQAAVGALAGIDDPSAARAIHVALRATDGQKRQTVVNALTAANDRRVVPMLVRVLQDCRPLSADFQVTLHALDALARLGDPGAVPAIAGIMRLRGWFARRRLRVLKRAAVDALARIHDDAATSALAAASREGDRMLRSIVRASASAEGLA